MNYFYPVSPLKTANIDGPGTLVRSSMFKYVDAKVSLERSAINFYYPYKVGILDMKSVIRTMYGDSKKNCAIFARMTNIMLKLFPPIPIGSDGIVPPITNIYIHSIAGLKHILKTYFPEQEPLKNKTLDYVTFDYEYNEKKPDMKDEKAGAILQKTIKIFEHAIKNKIEPKPDDQLSPLQLQVKRNYTDDDFLVISQLLDKIAQPQGNTSVKLPTPILKTVRQHYFNSLDSLISGKLAIYEYYLTLNSKMPGYENDAQGGFFPEEKNLIEVGNEEDKYVPIVDVKGEEYEYIPMENTRVIPKDWIDEYGEYYVPDATNTTTPTSTIPENS